MYNTAPTGAILTSVSSVSVPEGGTNTFLVRLSSQPTSDVVVAVAWSAGDANLTVTGGASLTFTTNNWATNQTVTLAAAEDSDASNGTAVIWLSGADGDAWVTATEMDNDATLTVYAGANGSVSPNGATMVAKGATNSLAATPDGGYWFSGWSVLSGSPVLGNANAATTTVVITNNATVQANFAAIPAMTCAITSPANGAFVKAGTNLSISATAWSYTGTVSKVEFYRDGVKIAEDLDAPYACVGSNVPVGRYSLSAKATDNNNATGVSAAVNVAVTVSGGWESVLATGGTVTNYTLNGTNYRAHIFTTVGATNLNVTVGGDIEVLVVGGGGGGGKNGGGGGAGGLVYSNGFPLVAGTYTVSVGGGGAASTGGSGGNGTNSVFSNSVSSAIVAMGGGGGAVLGNIGLNGGSGGGGGGVLTAPTKSGGTNTVGQGYMGGSGGVLSVNWGGNGGGGGAGSAGLPGDNSSNGGNGGAGAYVSVFTGLVASTVGTTNDGWFAGGGGGAEVNGTAAGAGGRGGGGRSNNNLPGTAGSPNTGGGGGGGCWNGSSNHEGGAGGSGIVIVRYVVGGDGALTAPTALTATPVNTHQIQLAWTDNATNETGYALDRSPDGSTWNALTSLVVNATAYTDDGLAAGTRYYYRLAATNSAGISVYASANATTFLKDAILASASSVNVPEGGTNTFQVRLSSQPTSDVVVAVAWSAGDANLTVTGGASLTFTTNNWATYQTVTVVAAEDADAANGTATITCSSPGMNAVAVTATETENDTTLTIAAGTGGTVLPSGATVVTMGAATAIAATASANFAFTNWSVTSGAATFANSNAPSTTVAISAPATVRANFVSTNINHSPVITEGANVPVTMSEDGAPTAFALTLYATDADGDTLTWSVATPAAHGTATASGTGASQAIAYTPTANYNGADSFAIQVSDGVGGAATTTVSVTIQSVNDAPVAVAQSVSTPMNTAKAITLSGSDPEGSNLTYVATQPTYGTLSGTGATRTYTPNTGYLGADSFTFRVNDGALDSPPATVSILVVDGISATGGTVTNYTDAGGTNWTAHIFTAVGTDGFVVTAGGPVEYLVVGGGGGGGSAKYSGTGGGGGGGVKTNGPGSGLWLAAGSYTITVGAGGGGGTNSGGEGMNGFNGGDSSITNAGGSVSVIAKGGGGGGGNYANNGSSGASGGGGLLNSSPGTNNAPGQGNNGGAGYGVPWPGNDSESAGGGGGGYGGVGQAATLTKGGDGGVGVTNSLTGYARPYAGGGGGGKRSNSAVGYGKDGGGNGVRDAPTAGRVNSGGGGGGNGTGGATPVNGAAGGSGIVIVRYVTGGGVDPFEAWRQTSFTSAQLTNPAISGPTADPDHDGLNNEQEYLTGTNPTNALSCLVLYAPTNNIAADGKFVVRWQSVTGKTYTVMATTNLMTVFTNLIPTSIPATPDVNVYTDSVENAGQRFYRIKLE